LPLRSEYLKKKRFIAQKVCTACSRTSYKIVPLTNLSKYLHHDTSDTEVNINISVNNTSEKFLKKKAHCDFRIFTFPSNIQRIVKIHKIMILCVVLCFCEVWYFMFKEEHMLQVSEHTVVVRMFGFSWRVVKIM